MRAELGEDVQQLIPGDGLEPGYIDELNPADLAAEDCLDTIARKLAQATGTGPLPDADTSQIAAYWKARTRPQQPPPRPWLDYVPRRTPPSPGPSTTSTADDDEAERPKF
ncbi:MAG TPA: hypothetical protein VK063_12310 [Beutenbergiaceae bacterium]|nr:hypothetical protein [Beutenbergiaceae bacterium]